jgi:hypothetical protein
VADPSLTGEHLYHGRRERLGDGGDVEGRVLRDCPTGRNVGDSIPAPHEHLAVGNDHDRNARHAPRQRLG